METIKLTIPNMKSPHCQMTVTKTVTGLGATVKSMAPAQVEIELSNGNSREAIIHAIESVGYRVKSN